jgi:exodeoxyribonuclease VII small subunit
MAAKKRSLESGALEDSLKRLEEIADELQQGDLPLEEALVLYEEGLKLSKVCAERLQKASLTVKRLAKDLEGTLRLTDEEQETEHD